MIAGVLPAKHTATATPLPTAVPTFTPLPTATPTHTPLPTATPTPTLPPLQFTLRIDPEVARQGQTVSIQVTVNQACRVGGTLGDQELVFIDHGDLSYSAYLGISAIAKPGMLPLSLHLEVADGSSSAISAALETVAGEFDYEEIDFEPEVGVLLSPDISVPEIQRLSALYAVSTGRQFWQGAFIWPHKGNITSPYGIRRLYDGELSSYHAGLDIDGNIGDPVSAASSGKVVLAETLAVRGNTVIIDHGAGVYSIYCHMQDITVSLWQQVDQGELIGHLGSTGLSTGPHLHWEMRVGGIAVNPIEWVERTIF